MTLGVSRAGSVVTKTIFTWRRSAAGIALIADAAENMFRGQRSGQCVYPK